MLRRLAALSVIATLALAGAAIACPMEQSASNDQTVVTASAPLDGDGDPGDRDDHPENSGGRDRRLIGASGSKRQAAPGAAFLVL